MLRRLVIVPAVVALLACAAVADAASAWTIQPTPNPPLGHFNTLASVGCTSPAECVAVGATAGTGGLSEVWNGTKWRIKPVATFRGSQIALMDVSCPASANCMATTGFRVTEHWNGSAWTIERLAEPPSTTSFEMLAVSCPAATDCTGFGAYTANDTCAGVAETWNGSSWAVQSTVPGGCVRSNCRVAHNFCSLVAISCPTTGSCMAVGRGVTEFWNGSTWTAEPVASPGPHFVPSLTAVSCTAAGSCTAVGTSTEGRLIKTLAEHWDGTSWTIRATRNPGGDHGAALDGVSCPSAANCTAVGNTGGATADTLAEHWNGTSWTVQPTPNPAGSVQNFLDGVSCPTAAHCTATGEFFLGGGGGLGDTLAEAR
jgi:hypothetical protein